MLSDGVGNRDDVRHSTDESRKDSVRQSETAEGIDIRLTGSYIISVLLRLLSLDEAAYDEA